jgi:predicted lipoprotein with Yx(FWY)xxD motif
MRNPRLTTAIVGLSLAALAGGIAITAAAWGSTSSPLAAARATTTAPVRVGAHAHVATPIPANPATVRPAMAMVGGVTEIILVDGRGLPLYFYTPDTSTKSLVNGQLAALWPPLIANNPTATGATGTLKAVATSNGRQVAYNGHFLYTFVEDSPGHVTGQGVQNFLVATPGLSPLAPASGPTTPAPTSNGYGY